MAKRALILLALLLIWPLAQAAIEVHDFSSEESRLRFQQLGGQLRCPKCENQSIADSNSPSAQDMRLELFRLIEEGHTDAQVFDFMRARFGEFIMYRPPVRSDTWLLWFLPPALVAGGLLLLLILSRRRKTVDQNAQVLSKSERQLQLQQILELEESANTTPQSKESP